jgi:hypothetical protein
MRLGFGTTKPCHRMWREMLGYYLTGCFEGSCCVAFVITKDVNGPFSAGACLMSNGLNLFKPFITVPFKYLFENTIEGVIYDILNNKKQVIATVMGDNQNPADAAEEILQRINELRY